MGKEDWKDDLKILFEDIKVIEMSKKEALEILNKFRESIAEPAFENLSDELSQYKVKTSYLKSKGNSIHFWTNFPRSKKDDFHYIIYLPKNSMELKLKLRIIGRRDKKSPHEEREEEFMADFTSSENRKISKEDLIQDIIKHYRKFKYEVLTRTEQPKI